MKYIYIANHSNYMLICAMVLTKTEREESLQTICTVYNFILYAVASETFKMAKLPHLAYFVQKAYNLYPAHVLYINL